MTHKGVIKATLGLACGWDLTGKSPVRLDWSCVHHFRFDSGERQSSCSSSRTSGWSAGSSLPMVAIGPCSTRALLSAVSSAPDSRR